jgi:hypothetical protein
MTRWISNIMCGVCLVTCTVLGPKAAVCASLEVAFGAWDITPALVPERPVWLAGYVPGRAATGVHDPLFARCFLLRDGTRKVAFVSVDLIGLQYPAVQRIRSALPDFDHVMVCSTHNHEGPDVIGVWGKTFFHRGVDEEYLAAVVDKTVQVVRAAEAGFVAATVDFGTAEDESLLDDGRRPVVKDGILRLLRFTNAATKKACGIVLQWSCHPEALGARNTLLTADYPATTIAALAERWQCPVVLFMGALGGLMAPPQDRIRDDAGRVLGTGDFEFARRYGLAVAELADRALAQAAEIRLDPIAVSARPVVIPVDNPVYRAARVFGVVRRQGRLWTGDFERLGAVATADSVTQPTGIETEVSYLRLGSLHLLGIPGELYPELVRGQVASPADPAADFPTAAVEPSVVELTGGEKWMLFGLANDEIGYVIPRRQWDNLPPYAYGRSTPQYGEINSCGPQVAPIIMQALANRMRDINGK